MAGTQLVEIENGNKVDYHFAENNHIFVEYENSFRETMNSIYPEYRHRGLFVTYIDYIGKIHTMYYNNSNTDDSNWGIEQNWVTCKF